MNELTKVCNPGITPWDESSIVTVNRITNRRMKWVLLYSMTAVVSAIVGVTLALVS